MGAYAKLLSAGGSRSKHGIMGKGNVEDMNAVDFFCGGGGMTKGLLNAGIEVQCGLDFNPACQKTYEHNNGIPYLCRNRTEVTPNELIKAYPVLADKNELLLVGCAPCQPFSNQRHAAYEHTAVNLLDEFGRFVKAMEPACVLIENVPGIQKRGHAVFERFLNLLDEMHYNVFYGVVNSKDYGVPQKRKRLILIAAKDFVPAEPPQTHGEGLLPYVTVRDAINRFPPINAGENDNTLFNHCASALSHLNMERIIVTPHDGGSRLDWPQNLVLDCHNNGYNGHTDVYGRMRWDEVSPTLTSKCFSLSNGRFGHPEQDRAISLREAAAIQSFDDNYQFFGSIQEIGRQIGNAVPVLLAQRIGEYILRQHEHH